MKRDRTDEELMRYLDGDLAPREARTFEEKLSGSVDTKRKVEAVKQIGDVMRARIDAAVDAAQPNLDAMWAQMEKKLEAPEAKPSQVPGVWDRFREWFGEYRGHVMTGALSAAAAFALAFWMRGERVRPVIIHQPGVPTTVAAEVENVDVLDGNGTVFKIPNDSEDGSTNLIWVTPSTDSDSDSDVLPGENPI